MAFHRSDDGPLAVLTLDHGDLNLFDDEVFESFIARVGELAAAPPRALLIRASGRAVSAGVDVHEFDGLTPDAAAVLWRRLLETVQALERWGVVTQVLPDEGFADAAHAVARGLASGPTRAHAATKRLIRTAADEGARAADALVPDVSAPLFDTSDLRNAVASFLENGPGKATYEGR